MRPSGCTMPTACCGTSCGPTTRPTSRCCPGSMFDDRWSPARRVLHTPGHSPGCCCFHDSVSGVVFSGDTLFCGGPGATGRSYSDEPTIVASIRDRLLTSARSHRRAHRPRRVDHDRCRARPVFWPVPPNSASSRSCCAAKSAGERAECGHADASGVQALREPHLPRTARPCGSATSTSRPRRRGAARTSARSSSGGMDAGLDATARWCRRRRRPNRRARRRHGRGAARRGRGLPATRSAPQVHGRGRRPSRASGRPAERWSPRGPRSAASAADGARRWSRLANFPYARQ